MTIQTQIAKLSATAAARLTFGAVRLELAAIGLKLAKRDGEFRVAYPGPHHEAEPSAYYTDDLFDALETGREMARHAEAEQRRATLATR